MSKNEFAEMMWHGGKEAVSSALRRDDLIVKCSVGAGNWSEIPWFGIFNPEVTDTATKGLCVVYLFSANMETVYLCQGQGVTNIKEEFGKEQIAEMKRRVELMCARVPEYSLNFKNGPILLNGTTNLAKEYEPAVAYYSSYKTKMLPSLQVLERVNRRVKRVHIAA